VAAATDGFWRRLARALNPFGRARRRDGEDAAADASAASVDPETDARREAARIAKREGAWGEAQAARWLRRELGWKILAQNVRYGPRLELDIVARQKEPSVLVFVEVKTSRSERHGRPYDRVDDAKRRAQSRAALRYLRELKVPVPHIRFDVVEVVGFSENAEAPVIRRIENAYPMEFGRRQGARR